MIFFPTFNLIMVNRQPILKNFQNVILIIFLFLNIIMNILPFTIIERKPNIGN